MAPSDNRASESALADLHGVVAQLLTSRLQSGDASTADINDQIPQGQRHRLCRVREPRRTGSCGEPSDLRGCLER